MDASNANLPAETATRLVLVIDDDADVVKSIQLCLRFSGWTPAIALDPREGIELARTIHPHVVLCDASMPGLSGPRVIEMLKENPATSSIPIVLMSGFGDPEMFSHVPWNGFLPKPFSPQELRAAIESAATNSTPRRMG